MAIFPKIQSPCPYKGPLADILEGDMCRLCRRKVVDLSPMTDAERLAFLAACQSEVCVSYTLRPAIAAVLTAAALGAPLAAAQDMEVEAIIVVGGMIEPAKIEFVSTDEALPELEIVHEDEAAEIEDAEAPAPEEPNQ
jgi:predicted Fe-S protein YdhL (DUF1289 family)